MSFARNDDVELVEFGPSEESESSAKPRSRRRKRRGRKRSKIITAAEILSRAAKDVVESSPSSVVSEPAGRKLSALDLDKIVESEDTTVTPASLDSSRSLWELGTIYDEDFDTPSLKSPLSKSSLDDLTAGIDTILNSLPKRMTSSGVNIGRLCVPQQPRAASNRLCIDNVPRVVDLQPVADFFGSVSSQFSDAMDRITAALVDSSWAKPEGLERVLSSLTRTKGEKSSGLVSPQSIPLVNRRQRRAVELSHDSPLRHRTE
jgi:hypothetical protein